MIIFAMIFFIAGTILHIAPFWAPEIMPNADDEERRDFKRNCEIGCWFGYIIALGLISMEVLSYIQFNGTGGTPP